MKIIKRNGQEMVFDSSKIKNAITKANLSVDDTSKRLSEEQIDKIVAKVTDECSSMGRAVGVEEIQDFVEFGIMEQGAYEVAKNYITYRYIRQLARQVNTTDKQIFSLIDCQNEEVKQENSNKNPTINSVQRDYMAGEVSKDLTKRFLLSEKIWKAHEDGLIHFQDADYFLQPIFNCCLVNIADMLDNGTVMNGKLIETPKSFQVACTVTTQIIASVASSQYGGQSIELRHLGKYLRRSHDKFEKEIRAHYGDKLDEATIEGLVEDRTKYEIASGVQTIQYQINTLMTTNGQSPFVTLFMYLKDDDPYIEENARIFEEVLRQRLQGIKNQQGVYVTPAFPKLVYLLDENNNLTGGKYDYLTELAVKCSAKRMYPDYISAKQMKANYEGNVFAPMGCRSFLSPWKDENGNYKFEGRFNQGVVSVNLPQAAIVAKRENRDFWEVLDERLDLCYEALMCRHHALLGTTADVSPVHWMYGAIARLQPGERSISF